eukprot:UN25652
MSTADVFAKDEFLEGVEFFTADPLGGSEASCNVGGTKSEDFVRKKCWRRQVVHLLAYACERKFETEKAKHGSGCLIHEVEKGWCGVRGIEAYDWVLTAARNKYVSIPLGQLF